jgi:hypothetical protein
MANYTIKVAAVCAGGEHITLQLYKDGVAIKKIQTTKEEMMNSDVDISDALGVLIRQTVKSADAKTNAKRAEAIEKMVITL